MREGCEVKKDKKFYIVFSRKEDGFWTRFERVAVNPTPGDGFDTREEAVAELNNGHYPSWYRCRLVEVLEPVIETVVKTTQQVVWR